MLNFSIQVVGTGSDGNCYLLNVNHQTLVIEAGVNFTKVKKALDYDLKKVVGVLVSHEHGDHADFIKDFQKFGKKVYCTLGTYLAKKTFIKPQIISCLQPFQIGLFTITAFQTFHDAIDPCGFLIEFEGKRLVFLTDSCDLKTKLKNVDYWLIEANYSDDMLRASSLDVRLKKRIQETHMSIDRCKTILDAHNAQNSELVMLIHGSKNHLDKEEFLTKIPYACIAEDGLVI
jgi:phosphoribosyl 1,2-cyclic phosphodiesterase